MVLSGLDASGTDFRTSRAFSPGSIHDHSVRDFWTQELRSPPWVVKLLEEGYHLPFVSEPPCYEEKNNRSALDNMEIVSSMVHDMIALNIVTVVETKPHCVNPLGLVSKLTAKGLKHRIIFDASRCVNKHIEPPSVKLTGLQLALENTNREDFQAVFDLNSAYYHVKIAESHRTYLGASIPTPKGPLYFVYNVLPFGLNSAVHVITKVFKPIISYLHLKGVCMSIYIDDGRVVSSSKDQVIKDLRLVYDTLFRSGWSLELDKSDSFESVSQVKPYLGFTIDTVNMSVSTDPAKLESLRDWILPLLNEVSIPVKTLAKIMGKITSLVPSHGPFAQICTRSGYMAIESHVDAFGWFGSVLLSDPCKTELNFFLQHCSSHNGFPIRTSLTDLSVQQLLPGALSKSQMVRAFAQQPSTLIASDASSYKVAIQILEGLSAVPANLEFRFTEKERDTSSGFRELLAIIKTLRHFKFLGVKGHNILWLTDSANVVSFFTKGSGKPHIQ
jgi:hypothetical protein